MWLLLMQSTVNVLRNNDARKINGERVIGRRRSCCQLIFEPFSQDRENRTALHLSASFGNLKHVRHLLKNLSNICIPDCRGKTPLHWAAAARVPDAQAARETTAIVRLFREESPSVVNWPDYEGCCCCFCFCCIKRTI